MRKRIKNLLILRLNQILRVMKTVGWGLGLVFLFVSIGILFPALDRMLSFESIYSVFFCGLLVITLDFFRKDKLFLISIFPHRWHLQFYLTVENILLTFPVIVFQCLIGQYTNFLLILTICIFSSIISPMIMAHVTGVSKMNMPLIPVKYFEFKFYVEASGYLWPLVWFAGFISYFHIGFYIFWNFIILMTLPEMFRQYESRDMLHWQTDFLRNKMLSYIVLFLLIVALPSMISLVFHFDMFWIILYCIICLLTALFMNISIKYAGYTPMYSSGMGQNTSGMLTMVMLIPGGVLIAIIYSMIKYFRAKSNLQSLYA